MLTPLTCESRIFVFLSLISVLNPTEPRWLSQIPYPPKSVHMSRVCAIVFCGEAKMHA